jgi:hypothetical protein
MIAKGNGDLGLHRRIGALLLMTLTTAVFGCGSSERTETGGSPGSAKLLKAEDYYRYEGEGASKRKVALSREEKNKLRHDVTAKAGGQ